MISVEELLRGTTELDGRAVEFTLAIRTYAELAYFLEGAPTSEALAREWLKSRMFRELATFDGRPLFLEEAEALLAHPRVVGDVLAARNRLHDEARQRGVMFAQCPGCKTTEAEISFMYLLLRHRVSLPPLTLPNGVWLPPPDLARPPELAHGRRRGDLPLASQLRFELPSTRMSLRKRGWPTGGVMQFLDEEAEPRLPRKSSDAPAWWYPGSPPLRALVRLAAAIARFGDGKRSSPELLQKLPAFDLAYLDVAVKATQLTDEPDDDRPVPGLVPRPRNLPVTCATCATIYLPLI